MRTALARAAAAAVLVASLTACGQKGAPLAPLHLVPEAVTDLSLRRTESTARLRFVLPSRNANGPGPVELGAVEVFAVTIAPGQPVPPNRDLLTKPYLIGQIAVRPAPAEGDPPIAEDDARPVPGDVVTFEEELTPQKLAPSVVPTQAAPKPGATGAAVEEDAVPPTPGAAAGTPPAAAPPGAAAKPPVPGPTAKPPLPGAASAEPLPTHPVRVYVVRGVTRSGRSGPPAPRVQLPVVAPPPPPGGVTMRVTETAVVLEWKPPEVTVSSYNVYRAEEPLQPLNPAPATAATFEYTGAKFGEEYCFGVRSVIASGGVSIEGPLSPPGCLTPLDVFPPAAPKGLQAVSTQGQISLIWDPNTEKDLAGYLVLRGDAPEGALTPLTAAPIRETSYSDVAVKPGVRYVYAVVAVDTATPPNASAESTRREETAR